MILRSIQVEGWQCFVNHTKVGPFGDRLNIIHAPNATGKSTLFAALRRGLIDNHRVGGSEVEALRPWGRSLSPTVTIEFEHNGTEYRIKKRFLNPSSVLYRKENEQFVPLDESDKADERVRKILLGDLPGRGLSRSNHWGLAQVLWVPQGNPALDELSGNLVSAIQESLGIQVSAPGPLEKKIEEQYLSIFTPTGNLRKGKDAPKVVDLHKDLEKALEEKQNIFSLLEAFENTSRRVEDLRARRDQTKNQEEVLSDTLRKARTRARSYSELIAEKEKRGEQVKSAEARYSELKTHMNNIEETRKELAETREELTRLQPEASGQEKEVENLLKKVEKAKAQLEEARKGRYAVDEARRQAEIAQQYLQAEERKEQAEKLIGKVIEAQKDIEDYKKERIRLVAPDSQTLSAIRKVIKTRDDAQMRLDTALITLEIVPENNAELEILSAEETGTKNISSGKPFEVKGSPEVVVDLKGFARIRARGPSESAEKLRKEVSLAVEQLEKLTLEFGTIDIEELQVFHEKAHTIEQKISITQTRLDTLLAGRSIEEIEQDQAHAKVIVERSLKEYPEWRNTPVNSDDMQRAAEEKKRNFIEEVEEKAEPNWQNTHNGLVSASKKKATLQEKVEGARRRLKSLTDKKNDLLQDGRDDRKRIEEIGKLSLEWDAAKTTLEEVENKLGDYIDDPRQLVETFEAQLEGIRKEAINALGKEKEEEGRLQQLSAEGPYSALSRIEEKIAQLKKEIQREELQLQATRLLHNTISQCRSDILGTVTQPVEKSAILTFQRIAGKRFQNISLAESFQPRELTSRTGETAVSPDELSGGEKEQLHLAVRLALAEVLSKNGRQLVVFDDILSVTDTGRLARILSILEEAAQKLQILILTCHLERYRGLVNARFFDLEELSAKTREAPGGGSRPG